MEHRTIYKESTVKNKLKRTMLGKNDFMEPVRGVDFILRGLNDDYMQLAMSNLGKTANRVTSGNFFLIFGAGDEDAELSVVCTIPLLDSRLLLGANADSAIPPPSSLNHRQPPQDHHQKHTHRRLKVNWSNFGVTIPPKMKL